MGTRDRAMGTRDRFDTLRPSARGHGFPSWVATLPGRMKTGRRGDEPDFTKAGSTGEVGGLFSFFSFHTQYLRGGKGL